MASVLSLTHVGLSTLVSLCDVEHTSFHFGLCGRNFFYVLFGQWPTPHRSCTPASSGRSQDLFGRYPGVRRMPPSLRDYSLYLFVLVIFLDAVVLSQVHVALDISISTLFTFVIEMFILILLSSGSSCSICCRYCGVCAFVCHQQSGDC